MFQRSTSSVARGAAAAALALALCPYARAGEHQICYRDLTLPKEPVAVSAHCRSDTPGVSCAIVPPKGAFVKLSSAGTADRSVTYRAPSDAAVYRFEFRFSNGVQRHCTVEMGAPTDHYHPQGQLVGYTTDSSGRAMTGVWKVGWLDVDPEVRGGEPQCDLPGDFVITGGGAVGAETPNGAMLTRAFANHNVWNSWSQQLLSLDIYSHTGYGIGLKIEGLLQGDLRAARQRFVEVDSGRQSRATAIVPAGWQVVGGEAYASSGVPLNHQFLTADAPVVRVTSGCLEFDPSCRPVFAIDGWTAASKEHLVSADGFLLTGAYALPVELTIEGSRYSVAPCVSASTSAVAQHPSVAVAGSPGECALTGIGAEVDWERHGSAGNLLWKLLPRPDIAGVEASSKDHTIPSPATLTAYAIGIKLVPVPFD